MYIGIETVAYPGSARESSRVVVHVVVAFEMTNGKHTRHSVGEECPISNGLTTVAARMHDQFESVKMTEL
jgi:hypothetical protein